MSYCNMLGVIDEFVEYWIINFYHYQRIHWDICYVLSKRELSEIITTRIWGSTGEGKRRDIKDKLQCGS